MTITRNSRLHFSPTVLQGLAWRAGVIILAAVSVVLELPAWARAPLSIAAEAITVIYFIRRYHRRGLLEGVLIGLGAAVATLALLGLLLSVLPGGITVISWGVGVGIVELVAVITLTLWRDPITATHWRIRRPPVAITVWTLLVLGVLSGALVWSVASFTATHIAPLALSAATSGDDLIVTVSSGSDEGPYELHLVTEMGRTVLASDIRIGPDDTSSITIALPADTRGTVELVRADTTTPLRKLILDTTNMKVTG